MLLEVSPMPEVAAIGAAGALGAWARYLTGLALQRRSLDFPWATFAVNVVGCLLIALALGAATRLPVWSPALREVVATGFVGAFTTFSTFTVETLSLARTAPLRAAAYVGASMAAGLCGIAAGGWLAGRLPF
jgi:CrcB protein